LSDGGVPKAQLIGLDATPMASGHAIRGIGRYVRGVVEALLVEEPQWCLDHLGLLTLKGQKRPFAMANARSIWASASPPFRRQDIAWAWDAIADRAVLGRRRPSLWHQTNAGSPISPLPMSRTLTTAYDLIPLHEPDVMAHIRAHRRLVYRLYLRNLRRARWVVAISETTAEDLVQTLRIPRTRIRVVYPVVEPLWGEGQKPASEASNARGPRFLFVGVPEPHKRPDLAVAAFARYQAKHHDGRLTFVGYQPEPIRQRLRDQAEACGVAQAVDYADHVDDGALAGMYSSGVLLTLSRLEGFGLPPVEALLSGGQAVAVPGEIYDEVLGDAAVRADSDHPDDIARAMLRACEAGPNAAQIERLRARYSPRAASAALKSVYDEALNQLEDGANGH
jgi:glycosyltransferase involved in cell wall biosynthesis